MATPEQRQPLPSVGRDWRQSTCPDCGCVVLFLNGRWMLACDCARHADVMMWAGARVGWFAVPA
jgi:hypothetical protein